MVSKDGLQFGIALPQLFPQGRADLPVIKSFLGKIGSMGYTSAWVQESVSGRRPALDPLPFLAYAAAFSGELTLGISIMLTAFRTPIPVAKGLATLDHLTGGRLIFGAGLGFYSDIYPAFGITSKGRAARFEEGINIIKKLWTEETVSHDGRFYQLDNISINPRPVQKPHPPIWFGAHTPPALRRAVRLGDGWMSAGAATTKTFKEEIKLIRQFIEEEGRDPATFALSKRVYVAVDKDRESAAKKLQEWGQIICGSTTKLLETGVYGNAEDCIGGLQEVVSEGIGLLMLNPVGDMEGQAEWLSSEVLPKLTGA